MTGQTFPAGRDLDAMIAEKVMGWRRQSEAPQDVWQRHDERLAELPKFSTDIAAAWQIVEKLGPDDIFLTITLLPDGEYECTAQNEIGETLMLGKSGHVKADSAPLVICRAALLSGSSFPQSAFPDADNKRDEKHRHGP